MKKILKNYSIATLLLAPLLFILWIYDVKTGNTIWAPFLFGMYMISLTPVFGMYFYKKNMKFVACMFFALGVFLLLSNLLGFLM